MSQVLAAAWLLAFVACVGVIAFHLRRLAVPWTGPPARLVEAIVAIAVVDVVSLVAGTFGYFRPLPLLVVAAAVALGTRTAVRHRVVAGYVVTAPDQPVGQPSTSRSGRARRMALALAPCLVLCVWTTQALANSGRGMIKIDDVTFHLPTTARFIASGRVTAPASLLPGTETAFNPTTAEVEMAVTGLASHSDALFPFVTVAWAALILLAAWCFGTCFGRGSAALLVVCGLLWLPVSYQWAGSADTDIPALAMLTSAVAVLMLALKEERRQGIAMGVAGVAAGIAIATKVNYLAAAALLTLVVLVRVSGRGRVAWVSGLVGFGSFWYLRNLVKFGNPLPALDAKIGFIHLVGADLFNYDQGGRTSVVQALTDSRAHRNLVSGITTNLTRFWPAVLGVLVAALVVALLRGPTPARVLALMAAATLIAYVLTPTSAQTAPGQVAIGFGWNMRWALPGLMLAGLAGAISARPRWLSVVAAVAAPILVLAIFRHMTAVGSIGTTAASFGLAAAFGLIHAVPPGVGRQGLAAHGASGRTVLGLGAVVIVLVIALWADRWDNVRYRMLPPAGRQVEALSTWADGLHGAHIATDGFNSTYPLYGRRLQNNVVALGQVDRHGTFRGPGACVDLMHQLRAGRYDFLAHGDGGGIGRSSIAASPVLVLPEVSIYRLPLSPTQGCRT